MSTSFFLQRILLLLLSCILALPLAAQNKAPQDFGFRYFQYVFRQDPVNILVLSQKGEEQQKKPLLLFVQGTGPIPLIIYDEQGSYGTFPFKTEPLLEDYHLVIIGKPFVPVVMKPSQLQPDFTFTDSTENYTPEYTARNLLDYYVERNLEVLAFLKKQSWVSHQQLIVAGHSEGSTVAAKMAAQSADITHLIYSGGNPLGRMVAMISQMRATANEQEDSLFSYWKEVVVANADSLDTSNDGVSQTTYQFSIPPLQYLEELKIPVLVVYGTQDTSVQANDFLRTDMLRQQKKNFTFRSYPGLEHNYFGLTASGEIDYNNYNWDKVAQDWLEWLLQQQKN